jgi:pimeloyl-ACP methyl ester carboxylesterase
VIECQSRWIVVEGIRTHNLIAGDEQGRVAGIVAVASVGIGRYTDRLRRNAALVLAVWGEHDRIIPLEHADLLVNSEPRGRRMIIPGGSHATYMSDPPTFHAELLKFLDELP